MNFVDGADAALETIGVGLGIGGLFLISTVVALPIDKDWHEIGSLGCSGLCVIGNVAGRRLSYKLVKHRRIKAMVLAKINTMSDTVSKALADEHISEVEYRVVLDELKKVEDLTREVRAGKENMEELQKQFLEEGRKEALAELSKKVE